MAITNPHISFVKIFDPDFLNTLPTALPGSDRGLPWLRCYLCSNGTIARRIEASKYSMDLCATCADTLETRITTSRSLTNDPSVQCAIFIKRETILCNRLILSVANHLGHKCWWCRVQSATWAINPGAYFGTCPLCDDCVGIHGQILATTKHAERAKVHQHMTSLARLGLPQDIIRIITSIYWAFINIRQIAAESIVG